MTDDPCPRCHGTLEYTTAARLDALPGLPCPSCLSTPATPDLRAFMARWMGGRVVTDPWGPWGPSDARVIPAYLPAGRDLLSRALAARLGLEVGATAPRWHQSHRGYWCLSRKPSWEAMLHARQPQEHDGSDPTFPSFGVPALATIPTDAPPELRAARSLVLCWEEVNDGS